jgi:hypothetical protein
MLGEQTWPIPIKLYGHPREFLYKELVEVPWAVVKGDSRRHIVDDGTSEINSTETAEVEQKLTALGDRDM